MNITLFTQILNKLPKNSFEKIVKRHCGDKHSKGIDSWTHLVSMLFCQFSKSQSIRDISFGMNSATGNLNHYGVKRAPSKSTISYSNRNRSWEIFKDYYFELYNSLDIKTRKSNPVKRPVFLLDSTLISLSLEVFDWAKYRKQKGAIKLHTVLDYDGNLPVFIEMSDGLKHDSSAAKSINFPKGSVVVADRGYLDFPLLNKWDSNEVFFVVRCKESVKFNIEKEREVDKSLPKNESIQKDWQGHLELDASLKKYSGELRLVEIFDEAEDQYIELLTNNLSWTASTISKLYKRRWDIESFFKEIKTHLKIKSFIGTSQNAVLIQIWTAMITILLLKQLQKVAKYKWHLSNLINFIRLNLFVKIELHRWIDHPFNTKDDPPETIQLSLFENLI